MRRGGRLGAPPPQSTASVERNQGYRPRALTRQLTQFPRASSDTSFLASSHSSNGQRLQFSPFTHHFLSFLKWPEIPIFSFPPCLLGIDSRSFLRAHPGPNNPHLLLEASQLHYIPGGVPRKWLYIPRNSYRSPESSDVSPVE